MLILVILVLFYLSSLSIPSRARILVTSKCSASLRYYQLQFNWTVRILAQYQKVCTIPTKWGVCLNTATLLPALLSVVTHARKHILCSRSETCDSNVSAWFTQLPLISDVYKGHGGLSTLFLFTLPRLPTIDHLQVRATSRSQAHRALHLLKVVIFVHHLPKMATAEEFAQYSVEQMLKDIEFRLRESDIYMSKEAVSKYSLETRMSTISYRYHHIASAWSKRDRFLHHYSEKRARADLICLDERVRQKELERKPAGSNPPPYSETPKEGY